MSIWDGSWGSGCCRRARFRRRHRRRRSYRSGTFTMKSGLTWGTFLCILCLYGWFLGLGMLPTGTFSSPASASSVVEVRDLHHQVGLEMGIIFMYNMSILEASWGSGCCRRARFRRRRRRRRSYRSRTFTTKSALNWGSFLCMICLYGVVPGARDAADGHVFVPDVGVVGHIGPGPPPRIPAWHAR